MNIWGSNGRKIGEVRKSEDGTSKTYDSHGQPSGSVKDTGTFDKGGRKITSWQDEGILLDE